MNKEDLTHTVGLMIRSLRSHRCQCERQIGKLGVHHSQHRLLMNIARSKTPPTQKELADKLGVSAAAISNAIKRLEADGYVLREAVGDDMRKNTVTLTDKGIKITKKSKDIFENIDRKMFSGVTDAEFEVFCRCLYKINENMKGETDEKMA